MNINWNINKWQGKRELQVILDGIVGKNAIVRLFKKCILIILCSSSFYLFAQKPKGQLQNITLQLKWKHQFQFAGYYAAIEKGFFKEAGLNVTLLEAKENQNTNYSVFDGTAEFGISTSEILLLKSQGKDPVILASIFQHSPAILIALSKSGILHAHDFIGKRVSIESDSWEDLAYLKSEGIDLNQIIVKPEVSDVNQLINGEIDVMSGYSTDVPYQLEENHLSYNVFSPMMNGIDFYGDVLCTSGKLLKSNPQLVEAFRNAAIKGWEYALKNQDEIINIIFNKYSQRHSKDYLKSEAEHMRSLILEDVVPIGYSNPARWNHIMDIYKHLKIIPDSETINGMLYSDYVNQPLIIPWIWIIGLSIVFIIVSIVIWILVNASKKLKAEISNRIKIQNELADSESLYRSILAASPDTIVITDLTGKILFVSQMVIKVFGYKEADVIGNSIFDYIDKTDHLKAKNSIQQMLEGIFTGSTEYLGIKKDGMRFAVELNGEFIYNANGKPVSMVFIARDISDRKVAQERIRKIDENYKKLVQTINEVIFEIDNKGIIKFVSPAIKPILGYEAEELTGKNFMEFIHPEDLPGIIQNLSNLKDRTYAYYEYRFVNKSREVKWVRSSTTPILEDDILVGGAGIMMDITENKKIEEKIWKANRFYNYISNVNRAIVHVREKIELYKEICRISIETGGFRMSWMGVIDEETKYVRPIACDGHEDGYLTRIRQIRISDGPEGRGPSGTAIKEGRHFVCNDIANDPMMGIWRDDAIARGYHSSIALPIKQFGKVIGTFSLYAGTSHFFDSAEVELLLEVAENISFAIDIIENEKDKQDLYENLEIKVRERTNELDVLNQNLLIEVEERKKAEIESRKARVEAELANNAKSEFLSRMSHELRTPMNSILGFAQLMEMGELNKMQRKGVSHILQSGRHLLDLINEVLDLTRIEAGRLSLSLEPVHLNNLIVEMIDSVRPLAQKRNIRIEFVGLNDNPLFVTGDRQRIKQVLLNLINNAIKYNRLNGSVLIGICLRPDSPDWKGAVRVTITDSGPGISSENIGKLFAPFERIGAEQSQTEGSGLGLVVVKKLLDAMGGRIGIDSKVNEGSSFWFELPHTERYQELLHSNVIENASSADNDNKGTILYIEDNISNIELLEQILTNHRPNISMIIDTNGQHAIKLATDYQPFLILLDLNLPEIHGSEILKQLKSDENTQSIPVVVISADAMPNQIDRLKGGGARHYLTKPLDIGVFLSVLDEYTPHY